MLNERVIAIRAVIASRLGMFLYPIGAFLSLSTLSFSTFSVVSASPPVGTIESGEEARLDAVVVVTVFVGETERVVGGLTAVESAFDTDELARES